MYQMALPYFPGNEKLKTKMRNLEERIRVKREASTVKNVSALVHSVSTSEAISIQTQPSRLMAPLRAEKKQAKATVAQKDENEDDDFAPRVESEDDESYASDGSFQYRAKGSRKPKKVAKKLPVFRDVSAAGRQSGEQTPRTAQLLRIINSRDVGRIKALKGVGTKKADAIVNCLVEMEDEEVRDLESLALLKGVGGRTVENMRLGLTVDVGF
jgi:DNA uptake protein ComE-like DNA-binding protein